MDSPDAPILGDTCKMERRPDCTPTPAWRIYVIGWLIYTAVVTLLVQLDEVVATGRFDWALAVQVALGSVAPAMLLALLWPLTGYLERRRYRGATVVGVHALLGLSYGSTSHALLLMLLDNAQDKPLSWHAWPFMYSLMSYAFFAGIFHSVRANAVAQRQTVAMQQAQNLLVAAELSALRSKLNPHFLFNTLHSIIALTRRDAVAAETALFQFSDMLRYILDTEKIGSDRVTLDAELDFVRDYLQLEALRLGPRLCLEWDLDPGAGDLWLPALTLQPMVENSIKHAFNPRSRPGKLLIRTRREAHQLTMTVHDDGPGADPSLVRTSSGVGIRTVERRLLLDYGERAAMRIDTAPGAGFAVAITIPLALAGVPD